MKKMYMVNIHSEYNCSIVYDLRDKYIKWFKTKKEAIEYARSIKKELKDILKKQKTEDDIFCLDIELYYTDDEYFQEDYNGIVFSLNLIGKY